MNFFDHSLHQNGSNKEEKDGYQLISIRDSTSSRLRPDRSLSLQTSPHYRHDGSSALAARLRRVDSLTGAELIGRKSGNYSGIAIPYFLPNTSAVREYRLRRDHPDMEIDSHGRIKPKQKYLSPPGRGNMLYFAPTASGKQLRDTALPLIITEGEFKTLALWRPRELESR